MMQAGMVLCDRYEIQQPVGKGGMSTVYQARDLINSQLLAVKVVDRSGKDENQLIEQKLTVSEGRILKQLSNPRLPTIYDIIENKDNFILVMDYIQGESLDKVIAREGAQSVEQTIDWGMQICEVLHYLHSQPTPIIYRDMKPANVMLRPDGQLMMIDFGTARTLKQNVQMQADTICMGTEGFAAPEQFGGFGQSTERTDIFCLGSTLYNMVTGHSPCERPIGILPLERWDPALANSPIKDIIYKCTRNDPDERYQTAMELYEDLRLASVDAFPNPSARGRSGALKGGFRKTEWQKLESKGATGGLSGRIQHSPTGTSVAKEKQDCQAANSLAQSGWQAAPQIPVSPNMDTRREEVPSQPMEKAGNQRGYQLSVIGSVVAIVFVFFTVILALLGQNTVAIVFLVIALAGAAVAVAGVLLSRKEG